MLQRLTSKFLGTLVVVVTLFGIVHSARAYTNPGTPTGFVNDFAHVLSAGEVQALNQTLTAFQASTTNEIAVVTIPSLGGDTVENYAVELFEDWKIGTAENDNGILLLVAIEERELRIEVGYGLEGALPDSVAARIIRDDITPSFREGKYGEGIAAGVSSIMAATQGEYQARAQDSSVEDIATWIPFIGFAIFFFFSVIVRVALMTLGKSKSWWMGGVIGGAIGALVSFFIGFLYLGLGVTVGLVFLGLFLDFLVSKGFIKNQPPGSGGSHWGGGFGGGSSGSSSSGGFGGFSGGSSGGGGASGRW